MQFLFDYTQKDTETTLLLKNSAIFFVPAVNYDGLNFIGQNYKNFGTLSYLSKNRHVYPKQKDSCPSKELMGTDLSRNYDW
jgi:hypothetical protein